MKTTKAERIMKDLENECTSNLIELKALIEAEIENRYVAFHRVIGSRRVFQSAPSDVPGLKIEDEDLE